MSTLRRVTKSADHHEISKGMLRRLVELAGWKRLSDITQESMELVLKKLRDAGKTVHYQNDYIKRAKAFVHWCMPERISHDPLAHLRRGSTTRALKRRARRAATADEVLRLFDVLPVHLQLQVAFMLLTGFRRSEAAALCFEDLRLLAPIPFIKLRPEWTKNANVDALPLHPALLSRLLVMMPGVPAAKVFRSILTVETLEKYWKLAGVPFTDHRGLRLDVHALRHTFSTWLDEYGCNWTAKKALTRHACGEVADLYSHSRLAVMHEFVLRLPSPWRDDHQEAVKLTGTDGTPVASGASASVLSGGQAADLLRESSDSGKSAWVPGRGFGTISPASVPINPGRPCDSPLIRKPLRACIRGIDL